MELVLINFRRFDKIRLSFTSDYCLISGPSGKGKTTIFMAIQFALTGEGRKLVRYGAKSCSVSLKFNNVKITRSKGPCRLIFKRDKSVYEDKAAEAEINMEFSKWKLGYVSQRVYKSFSAMTPAEKLSMIEEMTFDGINVEAMQSKCKALINQRKEVLTESEHKRKTIESVLNNLGVCRIQDEPYSKQKLEELVELQKTYIQSGCAARDEHFKLCKRIEELKTAVENQPLIDLDRVCFDYSHIDLQELMKTTEAYEKYKKEEDKLTKLKSCGNIPSGITDIDTMISETKEMYELNKALVDYDRIHRKVDELKRYADKHAVLFTCPSCSSSLGLRGNTLSEASPDVLSVSYDEAKRIDEELIRYKIKLGDLEIKKTRFKELVSAYDTDDICFKSQLELLQQTKIADEEYERLTKSVDTLRCEKPQYDVNFVVAQQREAALFKLSRSIDEDRLNRCVQKLNKLSCPSTEELIKMEEGLEHLKCRLKSAIYEDQYKQIDELLITEKELHEKLPAAVKLSHLIKTAERMAIDDTIKKINALVKVYTDEFFSNLSSTLIIENGKINICITMDEYECDISSLSGGEFARLVLAYSVAIAQLNRVPILMLDEILASLDSDTTNIVMTALREHYVGKIIVIAHQTTKGVFNQVIEL